MGSSRASQAWCNGYLWLPRQRTAGKDFTPAVIIEARFSNHEATGGGRPDSCVRARFEAPGSRTSLGTDAWFAQPRYGFLRRSTARTFRQYIRYSVLLHRGDGREINDGREVIQGLALPDGAGPSYRRLIARLLQFLATRLEALDLEMETATLALANELSRNPFLVPATGMTGIVEPRMFGEMSPAELKHDESFAAGTLAGSLLCLSWCLAQWIK